MFHFSTDVNPQQMRFSSLTLPLSWSSLRLTIWEDTLSATEAFQIFQISRQCVPWTVQSASMSLRHFTSGECVCGNEDWIFFPIFSLYHLHKIYYETHPCRLQLWIKMKSWKQIVAVGYTARPNITALLSALIGCSESAQSCRGRAHSPAPPLVYRASAADAESSGSTAQ